MHPYTRQLMKEERSYLYGPDILVVPICEKGAVQREVYLPAGVKWKNYWTGEVIEGGVSVLIDAPIHQIPLFLRDGKELI